MRSALADRREPVRDHNGGAPGEQPLESLLDSALGMEVDVRGGLVEHEDAGIGDQRTGEGDQLALSGRELGAPLTDLGVVTAVELADELVNADGSAAAATSASSASGRPKAMFSRIVPENRKASCGTIPICERSEATAMERRSCPSTSTRPAVGS